MKPVEGLLCPFRLGCHKLPVAQPRPTKTRVFCGIMCNKILPPRPHIQASPIHKQSLPGVSSKTQGTWWLNTESTHR